MIKKLDTLLGEHFKISKESEINGTGIDVTFARFGNSIGVDNENLFNELHSILLDDGLLDDQKYYSPKINSKGRQKHRKGGYLEEYNKAKREKNTKTLDRIINAGSSLAKIIKP